MKDSSKNSSYHLIVVIIIVAILLFFFLFACSNKKNTTITRLYHEVNTRYNVHFNANEAYQEALKSKIETDEKELNLSDWAYIYPLYADTSDTKYKGKFSTTIDKTAKAIKLHSISRKPRIDRSRYRDEKYANWIKSKEFNPFLVNTWMLLGNAQLEEEDYLQAISTFIYITKIYSNKPDIVALARLKIARAYSEMGWLYEAEEVLRKLEQEKAINSENEALFASIKANVLIRKEEYKEAIPYLNTAIKREKNGTIKRREKYLLAQVYEYLGDNEMAYRAYSDIKGLSTPIKYSFNANLKKIEMSDAPVADKIKQLKNIAGKSKFKEYKNLVYSIIGDVYLQQKDTIKAIENYYESLYLSSAANHDKALTNLKLGALLFDIKKYEQAQPLYAEAITIIKKGFKNYNEITHRAEILDELAIYSKTVNEQDSLLYLVHLPEEERLQIIEERIYKLKEAEKKKEEDAKQLKAEIDRELNSIDDAWNNLDKVKEIADKYNVTKTESYDFYFYNPQLIEQGKLAFQKTWGKRILEDNWRNKDKSSNYTYDDLDTQEDDALIATKDEKNKDEGVNKVDDKGLITDIYSVEYYLQQLPFSEEAQQKANEMIDDGLFNMALIYRYMLDDVQLTVSTLLSELERYPNTPHLEEIYYQLFLVYLQQDSLSDYQYYRDLILTLYPSGKYAIPLSQKDYAWNFKYMNKLQEDLYQETYDAYLAKNVDVVRKNHQDIKVKYPFVSLFPKFELLNALTYAQTRDIVQLEQHLTELVQKYPDADFIPLVNGMLSNIKNGMVILSDGAIIESVDWAKAYVGNDEDILVTNYSVQNSLAIKKEEPFVFMLAFGDNTIDRNDLLYEVADFNFSNYVIQTFDLTFQTDTLYSSLIVNKFKNLPDVASYFERINGDEGYLKNWKGKVIPIVVSEHIYKDVLPVQGLQSYINYYKREMANDIPGLLAYWDLTLQDINKANLLAEVVAKNVDDKENNTETETDVSTIVQRIVDDIERQKEMVAGKEETADNELNFNEILGKDVTNVLGNVNNLDNKIDEVLDDISNNPVEGIKNLFKKQKIEDNLTKEEKEELKQIRKTEQRKQKEKEKIEKQRQDSILLVEKNYQDSINNAEKMRIDSIAQAERLEKEKIKQEKEARLQLQKQKEQDRKQKLKEQEAERKQRLDERKQKQKEMEKRRKELQKEQEEKRKQALKEREELKQRKNK